MVRRSHRLFETGYYDEDGNASISYREMLHNIFRRRRGHRRLHRDVTMLDRGQDHSDTESTEMWTPDMWSEVAGDAGPQTRGDPAGSISAKAFMCFILVALLAFGIAHMHFQLTAAQRELQSLRQRVDTFAPLADAIPNFALYSQGARAVYHLSSDTYWPSRYTDLLWSRIFSKRYSSTKQQRVIQGHPALRPGKCWCFAGNSGHLFVSLSHPISITHVTLGHITKSQSPHGYISSAPRNFSVYGIKTTADEETHLGTLAYDQDGAAFQTFKLPNPDAGIFRHVKLQVENNWGNVDNTCLYNFRVHGELPSNIHFYVTYKEAY